MDRREGCQELFPRKRSRGRGNLQNGPPEYAATVVGCLGLPMAGTPFFFPSSEKRAGSVKGSLPENGWISPKRRGLCLGMHAGEVEGMPKWGETPHWYDADENGTRLNCGARGIDFLWFGNLYQSWRDE